MFHYFFMGNSFIHSLHFRTMLMNLSTLEWDDKLCEFFDVPKEVLPKICSSSEVYGELCYEGSPFPKVKEPF